MKRVIKFHKTVHKLKNYEASANKETLTNRIKSFQTIFKDVKEIDVLKLEELNEDMIPRVTLKEKQLVEFLNTLSSITSNGINKFGTAITLTDKELTKLINKFSTIFDINNCKKPYLIQPHLRNNYSNIFKIFLRVYRGVSKKSCIKLIELFSYLFGLHLTYCTVTDVNPNKTLYIVLDAFNNLYENTLYSRKTGDILC